MVVLILQVKFIESKLDIQRHKVELQLTIIKKTSRICGEFSDFEFSKLTIFLLVAIFTLVPCTRMVVAKNA